MKTFNPPMMPSLPKKHKYSDDDNPSAIKETETGTEPVKEANPHWARFFIIEPQEKHINSLGHLSPFAIQKQIEGLVGDVKSVKVYQQTNLLVEVSNEKQSKNMSRIDRFLQMRVTVKPHPTLNYCKGVVRSPDFKYCTEEEFKAHVPGVISARRVILKNKSPPVFTNTFILQFAKPELPKRIKVGYVLVGVEPFIPNPLRCFQCNKFGHSKANCKQTAVCAKCGSKDHESDKCTETPKCVNCSGSHPAYARTCPVYIQEKQIQTVRTQNKLSYPEARRLVTSSSVPTPFAQVVKTHFVNKSFKTSQTQCNLVNLPPLTRLEPEKKQVSTTSTQSVPVSVPPTEPGKSEKPQPKSKKITSTVRSTAGTPGQSVAKKDVRRTHSISPIRTASGKGKSARSPSPPTTTPGARTHAVLDGKVVRDPIPTDNPYESLEVEDMEAEIV